MSFLSGASGLTYLVSTIGAIKEILLMHDIHDGVSYCSETDNKFEHLFVTDYFNNANDIQKILEETVDTKVKLTDLWPNAKHTQTLKKLANKNIKDIYSVDIRPFLIPFSWELIQTNKTKFGEIILSKYLVFLEKFFNKPTDSKVYSKYIKNINIKNEEYKKEAATHISDLHNIFNILKKKHQNKLNIKLIDIYNNNIEILYELNNLLSAIMEWYIIILTLSNSKNSIIHVGLAHSNRIEKILVKYYKFKIKYHNGITEIKDVDLSKTISSCVLLPQDIKSRFTTKYYYN